jgi:hypothetical protein
MRRGTWRAMEEEKQGFGFGFKRKIPESNNSNLWSGLTWRQCCAFQLANRFGKLLPTIYDPSSDAAEANSASCLALCLK